jgi:hypothetical protein
MERGMGRTRRWVNCGGRWGSEGGNGEWEGEGGYKEET